MAPKDRILAATTSKKTTGWNLKPGDPRLAKERGDAELSRRRSLLEKRVTERTMRMIDQTPSQYRGRLLRALTSECSPVQAIVAMCQQCVGYEDTQARVGGCTSFGCPLHQFRPYRKGPGVLAGEAGRDTGEAGNQKLTAPAQSAAGP